MKVQLFQMLTIFPNNAVTCRDDEVWMEASLPLLTNPLIEKGMQVTVAATAHRNCFIGNRVLMDKDAMGFAALGYLRNKTPYWRRGLSYVGFLMGVAKTVAKSRFCYIYTPGHVGLLAVLCCRLLGKPYGLYLRGDWYETTPRALHRLHRSMLHSARFVLCTGDKLAMQVRSINAHAKAVVPMSPLLFAPLQEYHRDQSTDDISILFVGQIIRAKGIFELLEAVDMLRQRGVMVKRLCMAGTGADAPAFKAAVEKRGLDDIVECLGQISDQSQLAELYRRSDLFCLPTYHEGFPRVLYEAMRFSLPIVTTNVGQIGTMIKDGCNGVFCRPKDAENLADTVQNVIENPILRAALGSAARHSLEPLLTQWRNTSHGHQVAEILQMTNSWDFPADKMPQIKDFPCVD